MLGFEAGGKAKVKERVEERLDDEWNILNQQNLIDFTNMFLTCTSRILKNILTLILSDSVVRY